MKYKQTEGIVLRRVGDVFLLIPAKRIEGMGVTDFLLLNQVGSLIWECISEENDIQGIVASLAKSFSLGEDMFPQLEKDTENVIQALLDTCFCEEVLN